MGAEGKDVRGRRSSTNTDTLEEIVEGVPQPSPGTSPTSKGKVPVSAGQEAEDDEATKHLSELRGKLSKTLLSDEEALKMACEFEGSSTAAVNAAHRTRISKRATDLRRVLGLLGTEEAGSGLQSIDPERADAVLADFCKVLTQSQHEADYVLVLELGCVGTVMDTCSRIQDSIVQSGEKGAAAWRQLSSVMLSALKWLGLLSKQKSARVFMLLTNRVVVLADVAVGCLDAHFDAAVPLPETQSISLLCLPQVLHVLSHHVKQALPDAVAGLRLTLVSYLLVCGLADKLKDLFKRVEIRSMRLFDGASPVPMLLLRAMCFLATLVSAYRPLELGTDDGSHALVLQMLRRTEIFGIVTVLVSILLSEGRRDKPAQIAKLPQTVLSLAVQAMRILNSVARIDLQVLQETLVARELYHLLVCLLDYCTSKLQTGKSGPQDESDLLHETVVFLGFYCLNKEDNQGIMCYGEGQTLLTKITSLPLYYFMDERGRLVLFPTILASCFKSKRNLEMLRNEMDVSLLSRFLESALAQDERQQETGTQALGGRFPSLLWQEALLFFSDESTSET